MGVINCIDQALVMAGLPNDATRRALLQGEELTGEEVRGLQDEVARAAAHRFGLEYADLPESVDDVFTALGLPFEDCAMSGEDRLLSALRVLVAASHEPAQLMKSVQSAVYATMYCTGAADDIMENIYAYLPADVAADVERLEESPLPLPAGISTIDRPLEATEPPVRPPCRIDPLTPALQRRFNALTVSCAFAAERFLAEAACLDPIMAQPLPAGLTSVGDRVLAVEELMSRGIEPLVKALQGAEEAVAGVCGIGKATVHDFQQVRPEVVDAMAALG